MCGHSLFGDSSVLSSAAISWFIYKHKPRTLKALNASNIYQQKLSSYVRADNKNRFRFFVMLRERHCVLFPVPEDAIDNSPALCESPSSSQVIMHSRYSLLGHYLQKSIK